MRTLTLLSLAMILASCRPAEQTEIQQYTIEQFYDNISLSGGAFSPDETKFLVSTNETGIFNLYEIDIASGSKEQITSSQEDSYFAVDYVPGSNQILYQADQGGNEIDHLYLLSDDGSSRDLTPGQNEKASFAGWSRDDQYLYYISNGRNPQYFDLYKMEVGQWQPQMIYQNDNGYDVTSWSEDENQLALQKNITTSSNQLFLFDRNSKQMKEISEAEYPGEYLASGFSKDGRYFYYITNAQREFAYLVQYELSSGQRQTIYEANWDVMYSYLSENEKYRVIAINEDGKNTLVIKDNSTGQLVDFPDIPDGDIVSVGIASSEKQMWLSVGTSKAPNNRYVYDFESKNLKKLTRTLNPEIDPDHLVSAQVVRFESFDGLEIPAIYYKPLTATPDNQVPALVWVHGGPGGQSRVGFNTLIQYLVNHGYAILAVNNRGSSGYGKSFYKMDDKNHGDKDLKDCIWGKKWLQTQDYIDPDKIGIIGGSYGGYMTMAAMAFAPEEFEVGVNIFGVTNWIRTLRSIPSWWESFRLALYSELGDPYSADSLRLYEISPLFHAHRIKNPIMVLQGANDPRVLQIESDEIVAAVKQNNVPVEYVIFEDEGHGFVKKENQIEGYGQVLIFLNKYLKSDQAIM